MNSFQRLLVERGCWDDDEVREILRIAALAAAPAQPGEGEVWDVLAGVLEDAEAHHPSGDYARARALLERRGGPLPSESK